MINYLGVNNLMASTFSPKLGFNLVYYSPRFLYPAYWSIKALETSDVKDDRKWLTYWVVFAFFSVLEYFSGMFLLLFTMIFSQ